MKRIICCFVIVSFFVQGSFAQGFGRLLKETPGVVSYTFRDAFAKDVPGTLDKIKAMGITNIEFSNFFKTTPEDLRVMLDQRGMRCTTIGVGYGDMARPENVIKNAKILGAEFVRIASIPHKEKLDAEIVKKAATDFDAFGKQLKENRLQFCFHNHGPEFVPADDLFDGTFFDYLVQKTNPEYVSFEMDILWVFVPGYDPVALLKKYPKRFKLMHLKDRAASGPANVPMGKGQINIADVLKAARKTSIKYFYIEDESSISEKQVPESMAYIKSL